MKNCAIFVDKHFFFIKKPLTFDLGKNQITFWSYYFQFVKKRLLSKIFLERALNKNGNNLSDSQLSFLKIEKKIDLNFVNFLNFFTQQNEKNCFITLT